MILDEKRWRNSNSDNRCSDILALFQAVHGKCFSKELHIERAADLWNSMVLLILPETAKWRNSHVSAPNQQFKPVEKLFLETRKGIEFKERKTMKPKWIKYLKIFYERCFKIKLL